MAFTLVDIAAGLEDKLLQGILLQFAQQSQIFQRLPFLTTDSFNVRTWQLESVTEAVFRSIGESYSETKDEFSELNEGVYLMGGQIDIDRALRLPGQTELDAWVENMSVQAERFRYGFTDTFVNGDRTSDPEKFNGIKKRVDDLNVSGFTDVLIPASSANTGLELNTSANRQTFIDLWEDAEFEIQDGSPDLVITSKKGWKTLGRVGRREGLLDQTMDVFDKQIRTYNGIPVMWAGTKGDQTTEIITSTEDPGDGGNDATSFYFVKFGERNLTGLQMNAPEKIYDQVISDGVTHRTVFEWPVGLASFHKRSIVRLSKVVPTFS